MKTTFSKPSKTLVSAVIGMSCAMMIATAAPAQATDMNSETQAKTKTMKKKVTPRRVNHAKYDVMAEKGIFLLPQRKPAPRKLTKHKVTPRKVNHARYDVMAEKGIFLSPPRTKKLPSQLAKRRNHAEHDSTHNLTNGEFDG